MRHAAWRRAVRAVSRGRWRVALCTMRRGTSLVVRRSALLVLSNVELHTATHEALRAARRAAPQAVWRVSPHVTPRATPRATMRRAA
eukprot:1353172-Pleurochrysis_carterae.AAC.1